MSNVTGLMNSVAMEALRAREVHSAKHSDATTQIATGKSANKASVKPSDQALAAQMESLNRVIDQARLNAKNLSSVIQLATKTLSNMRNTLSTMDALAAQAQAGELTDKDRVQIHNVMSELRDGLQTAALETEFNGKKLFTGGAGALTMAGVVAEAATTAASTTHANAFTGAINAGATQGYISGSVSDVSVVDNGAGGTVNMSMKVGGQTFVASGVTPTNDADISFISTANPQHVITLVAGNGIAALTTAQIEVALKEVTGDLPGRNAADFTSASTAANGGVTAVNTSVTARPGEYALNYAANSNELRLSFQNGDFFTATITTTGAAQTITFDNGISVDFDNTFDATADLTQMVFGIEQGAVTTMASQTGAYSTDKTTISFSSARMDVLGSAGLKIADISLKTETDAAAASDAIKAAMDSISSMYGNLGAAMGNLELKVDVLGDTSNELRNAISGYRDADIPGAIAEEKITAAAEEMAGIATGKALAKSNLILKLANQA